MVEAASKKDFAPGKGRILKATLVSIGIPPISLEILIMLKLQKENKETILSMIKKIKALRVLVKLVTLSRMK